MRTEVEERRRVRSSQARTAASHLLERIAAAHALASLALCDEQGLVVVSAGDGEMAEVLAAYAPLLARTLDAVSRGRLLDSVSDQLPNLQVERVSVRPSRWRRSSSSLWRSATSGPARMLRSAAPSPAASES